MYKHIINNQLYIYNRIRTALYNCRDFNAANDCKQ